MTESASPALRRELFKYRAVNENTLALLSKGTAYFSSPAELNDPFDGRFVKRDIRAERERYEREWLSVGADGPMLAVASMRAFERAIQENAQPTRVYCLSEVVDSVLMWSHYADSHRGICVVLEAEGSDEFLFLDFLGRSFDYSGDVYARPDADGNLEFLGEVSVLPKVVKLPVHAVFYQEAAPSLFHFFDGSDGTPRAVTFDLVKHSDWVYEKERRVVVDSAKLRENPVHLDPNAITGVVFGMKTSKKDVARVSEAIESQHRDRCLIYSRMIEGPDGVGLRRVVIPDIAEFIRSWDLVG